MAGLARPLSRLISSGRVRLRKVRQHGLARGVEGVPLRHVRQRRYGDHLASIEAHQRRINQLVHGIADATMSHGEAWNFAGPGEINTLDFITRVYRAVGRSPKYRTAGRGLLKMMGWFSPLFKELPEMVYLQETPVILDDSKLLAKFPAVRKTHYEEGIRKTLAWMKANT